MSRNVLLVGGPHHGHCDAVTATPEYLTVRACLCCSVEHVVAVDADRPADAPVYRRDGEDGATVIYRFEDDVDDDLLLELAGREIRERSREVYARQHPNCRCALVAADGGTIVLSNGDRLAARNIVVR